MSNAAVLPANCPPRFLKRAEAAAYLSISTTLLDGLVKSGDIARPARIRARVVYDRRALDAYADRLSTAPDDDSNPFD